MFMKLCVVVIRVVLRFESKDKLCDRAEILLLLSVFFDNFDVNEIILDVFLWSV